MAREPSPNHDRRVWWLAFLAFIVIGIGWTMAMPLLAQPDEPSHAQRAAAVARGQLTWNAREKFVDDQFLGIQRTNTVIEIPEGYAVLEDLPVCFVFEKGTTAECVPEISSSDTIIEARPYTGTYPPLTPILQSPGGHFDAPVGLVLMRLCTVLATAALMASAVVAARRLRSGLLIAGFALALTPMTVSILAAINPSAIELAAGACLWLSLIDLLRSESVERRAVWRAVISGTVFILSRPTSPIFFVVIVVVLMIAMPWRDRFAEICRDRRAWVWGAVLGVAFVVAVVWILVARPDQAVIGTPDPRSVGDVLEESLSRIPRRSGQLVAPIGWLDIQLPQALVSAWLAMGALLAVVALLVGSWRRRLALALLVAGVVVGPSVAELPNADQVGLVWQGRYTMPIAMGLTILAAWTLHERGLDRVSSIRALSVGTVVAVGASNLLAVAATLTRHATGSSWPIDVTLGSQPWSAGVQGWLVLLVVGTGLALLTALLAVMATRSGRPRVSPAEPDTSTLPVA